MASSKLTDAIKSVREGKPLPVMTQEELLAAVLEALILAHGL